MRFATRAIRVGQDPDSTWGAVVPPIVQSATFAWESVEASPDFEYTRVGNPNRRALEQALASLENGSHGIVFGSGMAAIVGAFSLLTAGDRLLMASDIYGGTHRVYETVLPKMAIEGEEFDARTPGALTAAAKGSAKMAIFETPTNPTLRIVDIRRLVREAHDAGVLLVIDNTFASPALQNPLDLGVDIVVHSTTKYITGHSDVVGGAVVTKDERLAAKILEHLKSTGAIPSPMDCWLSLRGLKTLALRMERHCQNAQRIAEFLESHPKVERVHYPGLPSHPDHELASKQMRGFGGMVSLEVRGKADMAKRVAESCQIILLAESLGGVESLIGYPPRMSHASMTEEQRLEKGIPPNLLRLSVGIEDAEDLIEDLDQALAKA